MIDRGSETIFALASGAGRSAIAVIRLSGPRSRFVLETIAAPCPKPRYAALRTLRHPRSGLALDEALVLYFAGPRSETGEDCAELHVHGSRAVVRAVVDALGGMDGLRPAEPGEFALRALRNGKIDLLGLEALADLIDSETELQRRQAMEGGGSALRIRTEGWRDLLLDLRADLEAAIDFSDEADVDRHLDSQAERTLLQLEADLEAALRRSAHAERLGEGFRVALLGRPNSGKSSLINALAGRDVAIVSPVPGTTRDRIEVVLDLGGAPVVITDTAGLHETDDMVEQEGIRRSLEAARSADLVLWLRPPGESGAPDDVIRAAAMLRVVATKCDLRGNEEVAGAWHCLSMRDQLSIDRLVDTLAHIAVDQLGGQEPALITRSRQRVLIQTALRELGLARLALGSIEMCAEHVRLASRALERLLGRVDIEDVLGAIFSRFCVGK